MMNISLIGAGAMLKYQITGFRQAGAKIICLVDTDLQKAKQTADFYDIPMICSSTQEMMQKIGTELTAISILTPPSTHHDIANYALSNNKHVFCEKPPALNANEVISMAKMARKTGKHLIFDFNNRLRPEVTEITRKIDQNFFGTINSAQAVWVRRNGIPIKGSWFDNKSISGGGALIDLLHMIDLALYFMGYPEPDYVIGKTFNDFIRDDSRRSKYGSSCKNTIITDVETSAQALVSFNNGQVLTIQCSWAEMVKNEQCYVAFQGKKAGAKVSRLFTPYDQTKISKTCEIYSQNKDEAVNTQIEVDYDQTMGRIAAAFNFIETLQGNTKPNNTPHEAIVLMKIIDAIYSSAKNKKPIKINFNHSY